MEKDKTTNTNKVQAEMKQTQPGETAAQRNPLGCEPVRKLLKTFALPSIIAMLVNALYNIVDQIFIGQGVGPLGNAATTVAFPIVTIVLAVGTLMGAGGSAYAALRLGEGKEREAERTLSNVFVLLVGIGIVVTAVGILFLDPILKVFGATPTIMEYSRDYSFIILLGVPFNLLGIGLSNMARTDGQPRLSMYSMLIGCALNTVLDPIYIFVFDWGVKGAAVATVTSQVLSAVVLVWYFTKKGNMRFRAKDMIPSGRICARITSLGISSCITQLASTVLQIVMNNSLVHYGNQSEVGGDVALAAMGIVMKVSMILISICIGMGVGSQPILGFNRGARLPHRVREAYLTAITMATAAALVGWLVCILIPQAPLALFGTADANFANFAAHAMRVYMAGVFTAGFQIVSTNYFQATGQPVKASVLSMMRQLILLIPLILILPLFFGLDGILIAGPIADISSAVVVYGFVRVEMKKLNRWILEDDEQKETVHAMEKGAIIEATAIE